MPMRLVVCLGVCLCVCQHDCQNTADNFLKWISWKGVDCKFYFILEIIKMCGFVRLHDQRTIQLWGRSEGKNWNINPRCLEKTVCVVVCGGCRRVISRRRWSLLSAASSTPRCIWSRNRWTSGPTRCCCRDVPTSSLKTHSSTAPSTS